MSSELNVSQRPPSEPPAGSPPNNPGADAAEQNRQAERAQQAQQAQQAAEAAQEQPQASAFEFLNTFASIFQEASESYRPTQSGIDSNAPSQELQRDLQAIREFLREATRLAKEQKLEMPQIIHHLKAAQAGIFWNKLEQALQKGIPFHQMVHFQKLGKDAGEIKAKFGAPEIPGGEKVGEKAQGNRPYHAGLAMQELLKAETNPTTGMDHMALALQILQQCELRNSSPKLVSYLKKSWGMSDEEMQRFLRAHSIAYFQGSMPREDRNKPGQSALWYPLLGLIAVPIAMATGLEFAWAVAAGVAVGGALFILGAQLRK